MFNENRQLQFEAKNKPSNNTVITSFFKHGVVYYVQTSKIYILCVFIITMLDQYLLNIYKIIIDYDSFVNN